VEKIGVKKLPFFKTLVKPLQADICKFPGLWRGARPVEDIPRNVQQLTYQTKLHQVRSELSLVCIIQGEFKTVCRIPRTLR